MLDGRVKLTKEQERFAKEERVQLSREQKPNDPHARLCQEPIWDADPVTFHVEALDYAEVLALSKLVDPRVRLISANAVIFCVDSKELVLHERASDSRSCPDLLHTLGGAYAPPGVDGRDWDGDELLRTMKRELLEEGRVDPSVDTLPPMMLAEELRTGFVQLAFLGLNITLDNLKRSVSNREGTITYVKFKDLERVLRESNWAPSGKAAVLAWLALGAPGAGTGMRFGDKSPVELFNTLVPSSF